MMKTEKITVRSSATANSIEVWSTSNPVVGGDVEFVMSNDDIILYKSHAYACCNLIV